MTGRVSSRFAARLQQVQIGLSRLFGRRILDFSEQLGPTRIRVLLLFATAVLLRSLPEVLNGPYPVGFDMLAGYLPSISALPDQSPMKLLGWTYSPLAVYLLWVVRFITGIDTLLLLKIAGPIFYGAFVVAFYHLLRKGVGWNERKSFMVTLIFLLQPAVLTTGWDQFREELGLTILFLLLARVKCDVVSGVKASPLVFIVLSILVVLSHELAAVLLFVVVSWQILCALAKRGGFQRSSILAILPAVFVFSLQVYDEFVSPSYSIHFAPLQPFTGTGNFLFTNYVMSDLRFQDAQYTTVLWIVGGLSLCALAPTAIPALKGLFRDGVFAPLTAWIVLGSYSILLNPGYAFTAFNWWLYLLPIPFTVFAGHGLDRWGVFSRTGHIRERATFLMALLLLAVVTLGFATCLIQLSCTSYHATCLAGSTVPNREIPNLSAAFQWVNQHVPLDSVVLVQPKSQGLAWMNLRSDVLIRVGPYLSGIHDAVSLLGSTSKLVFAVWFNNEVGAKAFNGTRIVEYGEVAVFLIY